jgi:hypothetical protein
VSGAQGEHVVSVPLPATAMATRTMQRGLGTLLTALGALLVVGMIDVVGAAVEMALAAAVLVAGLSLGNVWWKSEAASYSNNIYKPLQ